MYWKFYDCRVAAIKIFIENYEQENTSGHCGLRNFKIKLVFFSKLYPISKFAHIFRDPKR